MQLARNKQHQPPTAANKTIWAVDDPKMTMGYLASLNFGSVRLGTLEANFPFAQSPKQLRCLDFSHPTCIIANWQCAHRICAHVEKPLAIAPPGLRQSRNGTSITVRQSIARSIMTSHTTCIVWRQNA